MFSEEKLTEIRERLSIADLISEYVQLKKAGKNFKGLCPFHQEKTPSFIVSPERETFHCFGCGVGGNLFHFLTKIESIAFPEAVRKLAEKAGVAVEKAGPINPAVLEHRQRNFEIHRQAAWYYHCLLKKTPKENPVWTYLNKRQISQEMIDAFHIGFCPTGDSGLSTHLKKKGFQPAEMESNSLSRGGREFFRGRILFPIFRSDNKVVGLGGRLFGEKEFGPKYLNSPESEIFKKGELFYGMHRAKSEIRKSQQVIISEGYLDVITLHAYGFTQAIAPLGTALTSHHARTLQKLSGEVILMFDGDQAGEAASFRALEALLSQGVYPKYVGLEAGEDPDSYLRRFGKLAFEKKLKSRRNLLEELIDKWAASLQGVSEGIEKKGQMARQALHLINKIPDSIEQNLYRRRLAESLQIPENWLENLPQPFAKATQGKPSATLVKKGKPAWLPEEELIFEIWLKFSELRADICRQIVVEDFCTKEATHLAQIFWQLAENNPLLKTGEYFDLAPEGLLEVLSELTLRSSGLEEISTARVSLEQAATRLREKRLRQDLQALKALKDFEKMHLIEEKIRALSQVIKHKERNYGERKNQ